MKLTIDPETLKDRELKLDKRKIDLRSFDPKLAQLVLEDFLTLKYPKKKLMAVVKSYKTVLLMKKLPFGQNARYFHLFSNFDPNMSAKDLRLALMNHLEARAELKSARELVFSNLWQHIAAFLPKSPYLTVSCLFRWNAAANFATEGEIEYFQSEKCLAHKIQYILSKEHGGKSFEKLFKSHKYQKLLLRAKRYPNYPGHQESDLLDLIRNDQNPVDSDLRREELIAALDDHGCTLRSDSKFANDYINGNTFATLDEVVAILGLTRELFSFSHICWSQLATFYEFRLEEMVFKDNVPWIDAEYQICNNPEFFRNCSEHAFPERRKRRYSEFFEEDEYDSELDEYWHF